MALQPGSIPRVSLERALLAARWSEVDDAFNRSLAAIARRERHPDTNHGAQQGWFRWEPTWSCPSDRLVGDSGDGIKWLCGLHDLVAPCTVYSFGSGGTAQFEQFVTEHTECEVHTFDPTAQAPDLNESVVHFHSVGLSAFNGRAVMRLPTGANGNLPVQTLSSIMKSLNHSFIDVLKIDIEGGEGRVISHLLHEFSTEANWPIGQMQIEVHSNRIAGGRRAMANMFLQLESRGFHIFHKEVNWKAIGNAEYAWVQVVPRCMEVQGWSHHRDSLKGMERHLSVKHHRLAHVSYPWARLLPKAC